MRFAAIILGGLMMVGLGAGDAGAGAVLDRIRTTHVIKLGYRADAKPYSYVNAQGRPAGYMVDLCSEVAAALARDLGAPLRTEFVQVTAEHRFDAVRDGRVDLLCDPSSVTLARREIVDFSLPTYLDGASVVYRIARPVERFEDFAGRRIGVLANTTTESQLRDSLAALGIKATLVGATDHRAGLELLAADKVDAYFADRGILEAVLGEAPMPGLVLGKLYFSYETYALAMARGDTEFRLLVDRTLAGLYRSGQIGDIMTRIFGRGPSDPTLSALFVIHGYAER